MPECAGMSLEGRHPELLFAVSEVRSSPRTAATEREYSGMSLGAGQSREHSLSETFIIDSWRSEKYPPQFEARPDLSPPGTFLKPLVVERTHGARGLRQLITISESVCET